MQLHPDFQHNSANSYGGQHMGFDDHEGMTQHLKCVKAMQDQATALSNSVQNLQQQLQDLQLPDQLQQELVPIQDHVLKTSQDLNRLLNEQKRKSADAERLEGQAVQARLEAAAAADRIQQCQDSLQAVQDTLAAKKHEIYLKRQEAQFKAAELEFHRQQLQHVSQEQRQAEELIQNSLDHTAGQSLSFPQRMLHPGSKADSRPQPMAPPHAQLPDIPRQDGENGGGVFTKLKGSMDKARMIGHKVVPSFGPDKGRLAQAVAGEQEAALSSGSSQARIAHQQELALAAKSTAPHSRSL